jgi:hypothetical protein
MTWVRIQNDTDYEGGAIQTWRNRHLGLDVTQWAYPTERGLGGRWRGVVTLVDHTRKGAWISTDEFHTYPWHPITGCWNADQFAKKHHQKLLGKLGNRTPFRSVSGT